jgi:hypothetical protein
MSAWSSTFAHTTAFTQRRAPFRSISWFALFQPGLAFNRLGSATQSDPTISSITNCDHDYLFELPCLKGSGIPNHYVADLLHTMAISGLSPQTVDELQNTAGFGFHDRLHHQLATAVQHRDHGRFLVYIHADILNVATHAVASLGEDHSRPTESFPQGTVPFFSSFS